MEPYREDQPWIRVNPEALKQSILETILSIPGARAVKYYHDNPEGSAAEFVDLLAEDIVPFYGTYRNGGDLSDYVKEAAMLGIPMPYIKHPVTGKPIPNNLKEGLGPSLWAQAKSGWRRNVRPRNLYTEETLPNRYIQMDERGQAGRVSSRNQVNVTHEQRPLVASVLQPGPRNIGSDILSQGQMSINQNAVPTRKHSGRYTGEKGYQGDMYDPRRSLVNTSEYGPFEWEDTYSRNLDNAINANNSKYEYLMNETRLNSRGQRAMPKGTAIEIALKQGRPDIAEMIRLDDKPKIRVIDDKRFNSYHSARTRGEGMSFEEFLDKGNRALERDLREEFSQLPNDERIRERFADHYGVRDLYEDWLANPEAWNDYAREVDYRRRYRASHNATYDRQYQRNKE